MTYWKATNGIIGHAPAAIMDQAIGHIRERYRQDIGRDPTKLEICELVGTVLASIDDLAYRDDPDRTKN